MRTKGPVPEKTSALFWSLTHRGKADWNNLIVWHLELFLRKSRATNKNKWKSKGPKAESCKKLIKNIPKIPKKYGKFNSTKSSNLARS